MRADDPRPTPPGGAGAEGPIADTIALNAGAGLYVYGSAATIAEGYATGKRGLASGAALATLDKWAGVTQALGSRKRAKLGSSSVAIALDCTMAGVKKTLLSSG